MLLKMQINKKKLLAATGFLPEIITWRPGARLIGCKIVKGLVASAVMMGNQTRESVLSNSSFQRTGSFCYFMAWFHR